jgi:hypothetical protein
MSLRHPRHRDGLHIRRYLIAESGLDYPPKQMPRWGEARHLLKNLTLNYGKY